jgi:hypothetical protein
VFHAIQIIGFGYLDAIGIPHQTPAIEFLLFIVTQLFRSAIGISHHYFLALTPNRDTEHHNQ